MLKNFVLDSEKFRTLEPLIVTTTQNSKTKLEKFVIVNRIKLPLYLINFDHRRFIYYYLSDFLRFAAN